MADITVVDNTSELCNVTNQKKSEGHLELELATISKSKLYLNDLHGSETSPISTNGIFSDRMTKLLTGEDGEYTILSRYNLAPDESEKYKQLILDDKMLVVVVRDKSSHQEVYENNSAHEEIDIIHSAEASKGPKA